MAAVGAANLYGEKVKKYFRWLTTIQWTFLTTTIGLMCIAAQFHRRVDYPWVQALRAAEAAALGSADAPPLLEHFVSGFAYTLIAFCGVQLLGLVYREAGELVDNWSKGLRACAILVLIMAVYFIVEPKNRFSPVHYLVAILVGGWLGLFIRAPRRTMEQAMRRPLHSVFYVAATIWILLNLSWEVRQLLTATTSLSQSCLQLLCSLLGLGGGLLVVRVVGFKSVDVAHSAGAARA